MPGKILRRCDVCKKFHASYVVSDPRLGGKAYVCYDCWKTRYSTQLPSVPEQGEESSGEQVEPGPSGQCLQGR